jgi:cobaltochelatase CobN
MGSIPPSYFDYVSDGMEDDPICNYFNNMDTSGEGLENAENLLVYLTMKSKITYIAYSESDALEMASETNDYSDLIEYTFIGYYDSGLSSELMAAAESGFLGTQDVILCKDLYNAVTDNSTVNDSLKAAHDQGTAIYSTSPMSPGYIPPSYFDYHSDGTTDDPVAYYYREMGTEGEGLENAENLLLYLATDDSNFVGTAILGNKVNFNEFVFVLGTDFNGVALNNSAHDTNISENLNITIFTPDKPAPEDFDFSNYGLIFIESQDESVVDDWTSSIRSAKKGGAKVISYNLSSNITLPNVNLYSEEYTDIERYWVQGGESNMENMLKFMGQNFSGLWEGEDIPEPVVLQEKVNITFVINPDTTSHFLSKVIDERNVITDCFKITLMSSSNLVNITDFSDQDVIIMQMLATSELYDIEDALMDARNNGAYVGLFDIMDTTGIGNIDIDNPPHNVMKEYIENSGSENMESWIRYMGAELEDTYIQYSPVAPPAIPKNGIYHPDAFPRIFEDSTEYLDWYADNGYNASAPTIGIINYEIADDPIFFTTEDAIIRYLELKGCNVIYATCNVCVEDVEYFTKGDEVLVDSIISLKGFFLNYDNHEEGVEYLKSYNVPVLKGMVDYAHSPDDYNNSVSGLSSTSIPSHVNQPELDGCIEYIWVAGRVPVEEGSDTCYYQPIMSQVEFLCDRAIAWADLGRMENADKKVTIIYYNHEGGKSNIGASYLDVGSSFTLLLERMQNESYDVGNGIIPNGSEFIDLFIESRNVGTWAPGELEKVVDSGMVTLLPTGEYLEWYNTLPESVRNDVEARWGEAPGNVMVYENESGKYFVIPTVLLGNVNFVPQPTRAVLSDESVLYHDKELPPTHQYLATYFWINDIYDADAIIHFGTHGTQEWLPGKEVGLWRYDYPSIMVAETPVIYPYIMDNVGEGTQAKRRGNAVIIDHLTSPIVEAGIYAELATLHDKIHSYQDADNEMLKALYRNSTIMTTCISCSQHLCL